MHMVHRRRGVNYDTHADGDGIRYHGYGKGTNEAVRKAN